MLILAAAAAAPNPVCTKLMDDFVKNERDLAMLHYYGREVYKVTKSFQALLYVDDIDAKYTRTGDSITTLMIGNKCPLPDHVTSPYTYPYKSTSSDGSAQ